MDYAVFLSPAKRMNTQSFVSPVKSTEPTYIKMATQLMQELKSLKEGDLQQIMEVKAPLLTEVKTMLKTWGDDTKIAFPAASLYNGDAYMRLCARDWDKQSWEFAKDHLYILSAIYGVLRATDAIQPYRLMVGSRWRGRTAAQGLYPFWHEHLQGFDEVVTQKKVMINLASQEYAQMLEAWKIPRVNIDFKVQKAGKLSTVSSFSKQARGAMARWIVENRPQQWEEIQKVEVLGYRFDSRFSDKENWIYVKA